LDEVDRLIHDIAGITTVPDTITTLTVRHGHPPMARTAPIERLVSLAREVAGELGFDLEAVATGGASDACTVAHADVPVLDGLGPIGGSAHSSDEWLAADSIVPRVALLAGLIARIAEG
jgi:glutamate carboxypeptidase